jgi:hypothetical protein
MSVFASIRRELVRRARVFMTRLFTRVLVDLHMGDNFVALLAKARAPLDRITAPQPVDDVPSQRRRHFAWTAIAEDGNSDAEVRQQCHQRPPAG